MSKMTFLAYDKPLLTCMIQADNPERIRELITLARPEGAEAFGMQLCRMKAEYRNRETYRELFDFAAPQPVYVTNYRGADNKGKCDETLGEELIELAECGATLCDVMGDYYDRTEGELTMSSAAIEKQMTLIDTLHAKGAEVLMSSHVLKFIPAERVLEIAREHQRRGADICKIVTGASSMEEQIENLRIVRLLKAELKIPFLFLAGGECRILRRIGAGLGSCMSLCVHEYDALATKSQPLLRDMKILRELLSV
ncbi:MAG: type I 3-dehydroquinate dehydratase [Clostridia bacterium]|nr:type I 3-dehydroquinate dehydratase [Clostridia bacterium]